MCRRMIALYVVRKGQFSHQIAGTKKEKDSEKKHTKNTQKISLSNENSVQLLLIPSNNDYRVLLLQKFRYGTQLHIYEHMRNS